MNLYLKHLFMGNKKYLFLCFEHQMQHFLSSHSDELRSRDVSTEFLLLDKDLNSSRAGLLDIPIVLIKFLKYLMKNKPAYIISITPKGGLMSVLSKIIFLNTKRIHWFTGQVWCLDKGLKFYIKRLPDIITAYLVDRIFCDSHPQKKFIIENGFNFSKEKIYVNGSGSICGVEDDLFNYPLRNIDQPITFGIVGRINRDKGIGWLIENYDYLLEKFPSISIVFYGEVDESGFYEEFFNFVNKNKSVRYMGNETDKSRIYLSFDILISFSYREGFSNVMIEAQAFGCPVISRDIYAIHSSLIQGKTGFLFSNLSQLSEVINNFVTGNFMPNINHECRNFAKENFKRSIVVAAICDGYKESI